ncbi:MULTISPECIES: UDP-glucose dehydrogenase family protein [Alphaproteobacteria]|uniref:UDP-glucose 6-dehydrogenase n=2 Tax=Alphaproteobacteria TaxID=28211 RepID=A0A512HDP2_9HYPH|nr:MULTISPECIES: UDP-glucose/GDP-mannose dehydrogenase family protein [Alphaproteobacteria]GEO83566.1 UDP-glucose 6-dehydrogenase [Ciceribacter naphthalenivorans]GLR24282.1 UDP-glucose 6-dehydrogenase [Ciceribacter naphthalenivorans]GLT07138.1 UDP-glucose 6-dehydrogenase [Sphingomonas psychrolutea]
MRIAIIGTGYVGLVSGVCLSEFGHDVVCIDKAADKISQLNAGEVPIFEPGLDDLIGKNVAAGRLHFSTDIAEPVAGADVVFLAVGTPSRKSDGHADLTYVFAAAREVAQAVRGFTVIVTKSTVPVGTGDQLDRIIREANPQADVAVVSNPEFLREGAAIDDFMAPDRVVVGMDDGRARSVMAEVYGALDPAKYPVVFTSRRTAELTKYAANAFLALKLAYINEIADLCEQVGANVQDVSRGMGLDSRIGLKFLNAGPGYGGSCFPKDTLALVKTAQDHNAPIRLIETIVGINETRKRAMARKVEHAVGGELRGKTIGILGLTFKPDTDDIRESPALSIIQALLDKGAKLKAHDPEGMPAARQVMPELDYQDNVEAVAAEADALVIITEWKQYRSLDFTRLKSVMKSPVLVDLRNIYKPDDVRKFGFVYESVGRAD